MTWNEITDKQANEYKDYLNGTKQAHDQLKADKTMLLNHLKCKEADLPADMKEKLARDEDLVKQEWGMYGNKFKTMRIAHQKEIDKFFREQEISQDLSKAQDKRNDRSGGR